MVVPAMFGQLPMQPSEANLKFSSGFDNEGILLLNGCVVMLLKADISRYSNGHVRTDVLGTEMYVYNWLKKINIGMLLNGSRNNKQFFFYKKNSMIDDILMEDTLTEEELVPPAPVLIVENQRGKRIYIDDQEDQITIHIGNTISICES